MPAATNPRVQDANQALRGVLEADGISERVCNEDASSVKQIEVFLFDLWGFTRLWVLHARDQVQALASSTRGRPDLPPSRLSTPEHTPGLVRETRLRGHVSGKPTTNSRSWLTGCLQSPPTYAVGSLRAAAVEVHPARHARAVVEWADMGNLISSPGFAGPLGKTLGLPVRL